MKIEDIDIGTVVSLYVIRCGCGTQFKSRTDRYRVECPSCHETCMTKELDGDDDEIIDDDLDVKDPT